MSADASKYNECVEKIDHLEQRAALGLIYEWVKTGHIDLQMFRSLVQHLMFKV